MKDVENALRKITFTRMSKVKEKILIEMLNQRRRNRIGRFRNLDMDELDQVVAAKGEKWKME